MIALLIKCRRPILYLLAALSIAAGLIRLGYRMGSSDTQLRLDMVHSKELRQHEETYKRIAMNLAELQRLQRQREQRLALAIQEQDHAYQEELARQQKAAAGLDATVQRLRTAVANLNQQRAADVPRSGASAAASGSADESATARELFAESAAEYAAMAGEAEQLRGQVIGLQRYVLSVQETLSPQPESSLPTAGPGE